MKKYYITDEDGDSYEIEEVDAIENSEQAPDNIEDDETKDFSSEEIMLIKKLLKCAPSIFKMFEGKEEVSDKEEEIEEEETEEVEDCDGPSDEEIYDSDEIEEEKVEEKVDDSCKKKMKTDSKKSFGSIEKRNKVSDSADDYQLDIAAAWAKRYGGNK